MQKGQVEVTTKVTSLNEDDDKIKCSYLDTCIRYEFAFLQSNKRKKKFVFKL